MNEIPSVVSQSGFPPPATADRSVVALLERLDARLERIERVAARVEALEAQLPPALAMVTDTFDDVTERMDARGVDLDARVRIVLELAERLTSPEALKALTSVLDKLELLQHVVDSGILAAASVDMVGKAGAALATAGEESPPPVGLWGAARAMGRDDVQRAIGFMIRFAELFGRSLDGTTPRLAAPNRGVHQ